jgi:hypothetical protein
MLAEQNGVERLGGKRLVSWGGEEVERPDLAALVEPEISSAQGGSRFARDHC